MKKFLTVIIIIVGCLNLILLFLQLNKYELHTIGSYDNFIMKTLKDDCIASLTTNNALNVDTLLKGKNLKNGKKLMLRISNMNCRACVDFIIPYIREFENNHNNQTMIVTSFFDDNKLKKFVKINDLSMPVVNIDSLFIPIEEFNEPYIIIVDDQGLVLDYFIPHKEMKPLVENFFEIVNTKWDL